MIKMNLCAGAAEQPRTQRHRRRNASRLIPILGVIVALSNGLPAAADSITVASSATEVAGSTWEYAYTLSGTVSSGDVLAIYFPVATSASLTDVSMTGADFTTDVLQPDAGIPADGEYDITANSAISTFSGIFDVSFTYGNSGTPDLQRFTLYDSSFATIESGMTATATPEPGSVALLAGGLGALFGCVRKVRK